MPWRLEVAATQTKPACAGFKNVWMIALTKQLNTYEIKYEMNSENFFCQI